MPTCKRFSFLFLLISVFLTASGQIYSPAAADSFQASYNAPGENDRVFIFNKSGFEAPMTAVISALSIDRTTGWTFQWYIYDRTALNYQSIPGPVTGSSSVLDTITVNSGYQVEMTKGAEVHQFRVWVLFNDFNVEITNKDAGDTLAFGYYNCASLDLRSDTTLKPMSYPVPYEDTAIVVQNFYTIRWTADQPEASNPASRLITRVNNPPALDTWYTLTLTDRFDLVRTDSVFYESIQSKANITAAYVNLSDTSEYPVVYGAYYRNGIKSAPGKYLFDVSASRNTAAWEIEFGDGASLAFSSDEKQVVHEYQVPGQFEVILTTKSALPYECTDTATVSADLVYARFTLPNVFTPNDDGDNDLLTLYDDNNVFRSEDVSVVAMDIAIFDRSGKKVHEFSGNIRDWPGWDGRVKQSNRNAPEGVYYYVISLLYSFEDPENPLGSEILKGFFHLFRE